MRPVAAWFRRMFASLEPRTPAPDEQTLSRSSGHQPSALTGFPDGNNSADVFLSDAFWQLPHDGQVDFSFEWLTQSLESVDQNNPFLNIDL